MVQKDMLIEVFMTQIDAKVYRDESWLTICLPHRYRVQIPCDPPFLGLWSNLAMTGRLGRSNLGSNPGNPI